MKQQAVSTACTVSIIIPCINEEKNLPVLLERLAKQDYQQEYEIIVADGGSIDGTVEMATQAGAKVVQVARGVSVQRNAGVASSSAPFIALIDADCLPRPDWLRRGVEHLEQGAAIAGGPVYAPEKYPAVAKAWNVHTRARIVRLKDEPTGPSRLITTANMFVAKKAFEEAGRLDENVLAGEDSLFCDKLINQMKQKAVFDEGLALEHLGQPKSLEKFFREQAWHCQSHIREKLRPSGHGGASFLYAKLTILTIFSAIAGIFVTSVTKHVLPAIIGLDILVGLPALVALRTCVQAKSFRMFLPLIAVYFTYGLARAAAITGFYKPAYHRKNDDREHSF